MAARKQTKRNKSNSNNAATYFTLGIKVFYSNIREQSWLHVVPEGLQKVDNPKYKKPSQSEQHSKQQIPAMRIERMRTAAAWLLVAIYSIVQ